MTVSFSIPSEINSKLNQIERALYSAKLAVIKAQDQERQLFTSAIRQQNNDAERFAIQCQKQFTTFRSYSKEFSKLADKVQAIWGTATVLQLARFRDLRTFIPEGPRGLDREVSFPSMPYKAISEKDLSPSEILNRNIEIIKSAISSLDIYIKGLEQLIASNQNISAKEISDLTRKIGEFAQRVFQLRDNFRKECDAFPQMKAWTIIATSPSKSPSKRSSPSTPSPVYASGSPFPDSAVISPHSTPTKCSTSCQTDPWSPVLQAENRERSNSSTSSRSSTLPLITALPPLCPSRNASPIPQPLFHGLPASLPLNPVSQTENRERSSSLISRSPSTLITNSPPLNPNSSSSPALQPLFPDLPVPPASQVSLRSFPQGYTIQKNPLSPMQLLKIMAPGACSVSKFLK